MTYELIKTTVLFLGTSIATLLGALRPGKQAQVSGGRLTRPHGDLARRAIPLRAAGFTVPELLTSLAVVAIVAGLSVPAFTRLMLDTRVKTAAFDVYSTMVYARSEAIKRNANVEIIPTGGNWKN